MRMPEDFLLSRIRTDAEQAVEHRPHQAVTRARLKQHARRGVLRANRTGQPRRSRVNHLPQLANHAPDMRLLAAAHSLLRQRQILLGLLLLRGELFNQSANRRVLRARHPQDIRLTDQGRADILHQIRLNILKAPRGTAQIMDAKPRHRQHILGKRAVTRP